MGEQLTVEVFAPSSIGMGNIMWRQKHPMRGGKFPATHPCAISAEPMVIGTAKPSDCPIGKFRALGYWASCFPEGDGITFSAPDEKTTEALVSDIESCFGWRVVVKRPFQLRTALRGGE